MGALRDRGRGRLRAEYHGEGRERQPELSDILLRDLSLFAQQKIIDLFLDLRQKFLSFLFHGTASLVGVVGEILFSVLVGIKPTQQFLFITKIVDGVKDQIQGLHIIITSWVPVAR